jgi:hypothetical protein
MGAETARVPQLRPRLNTGYLRDLVDVAFTIAAEVTKHAMFLRILTA